MSVEKNPRGGFQIQSMKDVAKISRRSEREFARYLFTKRRVYEIWYEPDIYVPNNLPGVETAKRSTVPDFKLIKISNGLKVPIEITIQPEENNGVDPKAEHRKVVRNADPNARYVVFYRKQLEKIAKHGGYDFFSDPKYFKPKKKVSEAHRMKRRKAA